MSKEQIIAGLYRQLATIYGKLADLCEPKESTDNPAQPSLFPAYSLPTNEEVVNAWMKLAGSFPDRPRLTSMLENAILRIVRKENGIHILFLVTNHAQVEWIENKELRGLELKLRDILALERVYLSVDVFGPDNDAENEAPVESNKVAAAKPKKGNTHWSFEDDNRLRRMYKDGKTDEEIGAELGRSPHAIKIRRFNLRLVEREQRPKGE